MQQSGTSNSIYDILVDAGIQVGQSISKNNIIALTSGYGFKSEIKIAVLGLEKMGMDPVITEVSADKISKDHMPCLFLLKGEKVALMKDINHMGITAITCDSNGEKIFSFEEFAEIYSGKLIAIKPILMSNTLELVTGIKNENNWLFSVLAYFKRLYLKTLFATFLANILALMVPLYSMNVYDRVIPNYSSSTLWVLTLGVFLAVLFEFMLRNIKSYFLDYSNQRSDIILSHKLLDRVLHSRIGQKRHLAGSLAGYMKDLEVIREYLSSVTLNMIMDLPFSILFFLLIFLVGGVEIFLVTVTIAALLVLTGYIVKNVSERYTHGTFELSNRKTSFLVEALLGLETIKLNLAEKKIQAAWDSLAERHSEASKANHLIFSFATNLIAFLQSTSYILVMLFGVYEVFGGHLSVGGLIACMILSARATQPFSQASVLLIKFNSVKMAYSGLDEIMNSSLEISELNKYLPKHTVDGAIEFDHVSFSYDGEKDVLSDVSFKISPKDKIAIVGMIGSGKTTMGKLIVNLFQPSRGTINVDGIGINEIHPYDLRANIAYVSQDVFLFNGTVMENVLMNPLSGKSTNQSIQNALKVSGLDEIFGKTPKGLNTNVGEAGRMLSGGQRQSIAIARALVNDPSVLILDEPISAMDKLSSYRFLNNLNEYAKDKTLIIVSHQLSVLQSVDKVLMLEKGKVKFFGTSEDFLRSQSYA